MHPSSVPLRLCAFVLSYGRADTEPQSIFYWCREYRNLYGFREFDDCILTANAQDCSFSASTAGTMKEKCQASGTVGALWLQHGILETTWRFVFL